MTRRAAKVDANQPDIVDALRKIGCSVQLLHMVGSGCPDILVGYHGVNYLIEIKDDSQPASKAKLNDLQIEWHQSWRGHRSVARNVDEAIMIVTSKTII